MIGLGFIISFPTLVEIEEDNILLPTFLSPGDNGGNVTLTKHHDQLQNSSKLNCSDSCLSDIEISEITSCSEAEQLSILDKKNEYLSSNLIETNSHLLILYEQIKSLETRIQEKIEQEQQFLYQVISRPALEHVKKTQQLISDHGQLSLDMIEMKKNITTLHEDILSLKQKMDNFSSVTSSTSVPILSLRPSAGSGSGQGKQNLLVARCLFPTVVTVAAIVVNMYLYVITTRKFPI